MEVTKEFIPKNEDEKIIEIEIERLRSFKNHPFQVKDDKEMYLLKESIEKYGILNPLIVRPVPDGVYEIISGHRRKHAAELLGYRKVPVIIRVMTEDESILNMVDSNLHRERISFSEKAFAYKMKNDVLKRKSGRKKGQIDHKTKKKRTVEIISEECGDSPKQVQRYISLTRLIPEFLQKLDDELISFNPAVEASYLKEEEQKQLLEAMDYAQAVPSLSQGILLTMVDFRTNYAKDIASRVRETYGSTNIKVASNHRLVSYSDYADDRILLLDPASDFLDQYIEKEMVRDFLGCLTARQKEIIQLFYFEEMNQEKIADYLGIRQQSVCEMMQRALSVMKKHADAEEN